MAVNTLGEPCHMNGQIHASAPVPGAPMTGRLAALLAAATPLP